MTNKRFVKSLPAITSIESNGKFIIKVWNREYTISENSPFFSSIISNNEELLSSPMRISGVEHKKEIVWNNGRCFKMSDCDETFMDFCQSFESENFILNTHLHAEYDGAMDWSFSIMPRDYTVPQKNNLEKRPEFHMDLSRLWIEIPLKPTIAKYYQHFPSSDTILDGEKSDTSPELLKAGYFPKKNILLPFKQQFYIGNDNIGFASYFESDRNWQPNDKECTFEAFWDDENVVMRFHLLDSEPRQWIKEKELYPRELLPISFHIGMIATPIKPFPQNPYTEKIMHIDCFKKIASDYDDYLFTHYEDTNEITIDRFKRLGVKTLYLHEKWNDIQNSPFLTEKTANRLRMIVIEAHKRGMKVIPYFGFEISTLSPLFYENFTNFRSRALLSNHSGQWYRVPAQRAPMVCYNSDFSDIFVDRIAQLMDEYQFDGIYLDSTAITTICNNESHGCGYRDLDNNLHWTFTTKAKRKLLKRLYEVVDSRGGTICAHVTGFPLSNVAFVHSLLDGESIQNPLLHGKISKIPEGHFCALYSGKNIGLPLETLCYPNPPTWTFAQGGLSAALPIGVLPRVIDDGESLEQMSKIWTILDEFPIEGSSWNPFYDNNVIVSNSDIKVSFYKNNNNILIFVANWNNLFQGQVKITLPFELSSLINTLTNKYVDISDNSFELNFNKIDYVILKATEKD